MNANRLNYITLLTYTLIYFFGLGITNDNVLGASTIENIVDKEISFPSTNFSSAIKTTTAFDQKEIEEYETIAFDTEYILDDDVEYGVEEVTRPGVTGLKTYTYLLTYWIDEEIDKQLLFTETEDPINEIISKGTKIIWRKLSTPEYGEIKYWGKLEVFATKYDSTCLGCNNTTALGAPVQQGVCAVDPKTIKMYTHFYVPGYGKCQALDVGGLIKGNRIDLAYEDAYSAPWGAEYVTIYLMDNVPTFEDD